MCNKFQQSSSLRRKPFTVDVLITNGNGQQIQVCNLLVLITKNVACLNWHVISLKKLKSHPKKFRGVGNSAFKQVLMEKIHLDLHLPAHVI